jgi:hypothetical protein
MRCAHRRVVTEIRNRPRELQYALPRTRGKPEGLHSPVQQRAPGLIGRTDAVYLSICESGIALTLTRELNFARAILRNLRRRASAISEGVAIAAAGA